MIQRVSIKNFESIKSLEFDLGCGMNVFVGPSNSGKSAILRAMKLAIYNEFNPDSVRVGSKFCEVEIWTDKGRVRVQRGPDRNFWEHEVLGGTVEKYEKIGAKAPQEVMPVYSEILGMKFAEIGGKKFNINIMNQLDGHFMLDEVDGDRVSPSTNAAIIDELCCLHKIEDLIKNMSVDIRQSQKEVKAIEGEIDQVDFSLAKYSDLKQRENVALKLGVAVSEVEDIDSSLVLIRKHTVSGNELLKNIESASESISKIPIVDVHGAEMVVSRLSNVENLSNGFYQAKAHISDVSSAVLKIATVDQTLVDSVHEKLTELFFVESTMSQIAAAERGVKYASSHLASLSESVDTSVADELVDKLALIGKYNLLSASVGSYSRQISKIPVAQIPDVVTENIEVVNLLSGHISLAKSVSESIKRYESELDRANKTLESSELELSEFLKTVKVCPLTNKAISSSCLNN